MAHFEKKLSGEELYRGRIISLTLDQVALENGRQADREVVHHPGGVGIVALTDALEIYLVRQFRYPFHRELLEIPAGKLEAGEDPFQAAVRELEEECGLTADHYVDLHPMYPSVAYDTEIISMYLATGLHESRQHLDEDEFLTLEKYPLRTVWDMVMGGELHDAKTALAVLKIQAMLDRGEMEPQTGEEV